MIDWQLIETLPSEQTLVWLYVPPEEGRRWTAPIVVWTSDAADRRYYYWMKDATHWAYIPEGP